MSDKILQPELPNYRCHKEVRALKIKEVKVLYPGGLSANNQLVFEDLNYPPIEVSAGWVSRHEVCPGGYYVLYRDGYASFSPAEAFEEGYTRI